MIKPDTRTVSEILSTGKHQLVIPKNQRSFDWGKEEVRELIDDLQNSQSADRNGLFLGTMIFENSEALAWKIVDGQQRLTTISILLIACRTRARELGNSKQAQGIQEKITFIDEVSAESRGTRIIPSPSIKDIYEFVCDDEWDGSFPVEINGKRIKRQSNKVKPVYDFIYASLKDYKQRELDNLLRALFDAYVIQITIADPNEAFEIFERTNARGLELNVGDLVKNYLFSNDPTEEVSETWESIVANSNNTLHRMLKYFWVSQEGHITKPELYRAIKRRGNIIGGSELAKEIHAFSRYYKVAQSLDEVALKEWLAEIGLTTLSQNQDYYQTINRVLQALKFFAVTQAYPLLYSMLVSFMKDTSASPQTKIKALLRSLQNIEKYHFINTAICDRIGNEVEKFYAAYCVKLKQDYLIQLKAFNKDLNQKLAEKDEFIARFKDISYSVSSPELINYIFDRVNNFNSKGGQRVDLYLPSKDFLKRNFNIDHILPQATKQKDTTSQATIEAIDNIGNLLVLSRHSNSEFQDAAPKQKFKMLKNDAKHTGKLSYLRDFLSKYEAAMDNWGEMQIYSRAQDLAEDGYDRIWRLQV